MLRISLGLPDSTCSLSDQTHSHPTPSIDRSFSTLRYRHSFTLPFSYETSRDRALSAIFIAAPRGAGRRCIDMIIPKAEKVSRSTGNRIVACPVFPRTCWVLHAPAVGSQHRWVFHSTFPDSRVNSLHGWKSPDIGLFKKKKKSIIATTFVASRMGKEGQGEGEGALASDDSIRFGMATRARRTSVEEVEVEGGASRGRRENRQKLSALTSNEWLSSGVNALLGADADPRTVDGTCDGSFHTCSLLSRP